MTAGEEAALLSQTSLMYLCLSLSLSPSSPAMSPPLLPSSSGPSASSRPDQDVGGIKRDQRQKAASRKPQTHRNGK